MADRTKAMAVTENILTAHPDLAGLFADNESILHGEADVRVPISQGYEFYNALKRQGVTTQMVVYPRTPHGPREPKFQLDLTERHLAWMEKYVR